MMTGPEASRTIDALVDEITADVSCMQRRMLETWMLSEAYASHAARREWFAKWRRILKALTGRTVADPSTGRVVADASTIALAQAALAWFEAHMPELLGEPQGETHMHTEHLTGRALDAAVARHVFGLAVEERTNTRTGAPDYVYPASDGGVLRVPAYSTDFTASLGVGAWLEDRGWQRMPEPPWGFRVFRHSDGRLLEYSGPLEHAIARAAVTVATG